ncbi:Indole-3-glycerol phosphate synthase / Phosphoribosylanthranilate isomerase [Salmonella enterica subsp. arizonae]|nr:Indole-3-glycerol phosphate synthase / Phosphoribosylanthranilate isomerase [Salmonella enterica subsp. arizonae]
MIFAPASPRVVNIDQAREIIAAAPLQYVGVFQDADIADVCQKAAVLSLSAIQLHGSENQAYVNALREALPRDLQIWKALSVGDTLPARDYHHVDKYIFDNGQGGSGQRFDWSLLQGQPLDNVLLAGGLAPITVSRRRKPAVPVLILILVWRHSQASKMLVFWPRFFRHCAHIKEKYDNTSQSLLW